MAFTAQELNTKIQLQSMTTTRGPDGETVTAWTTYAEAFAKVEPLLGREFIAAAEAQSEIAAKVTMRWRDGVSARHRVLVDGEAFEIVSAQNIRTRNRELLLYVKRLQ